MALSYASTMSSHKTFTMKKHVDVKYDGDILDPVIESKPSWFTWTLAFDSTSTQSFCIPPKERLYEIGKQVYLQSNQFKRTIREKGSIWGERKVKIKDKTSYKIKDYKIYI